MDTTLRRRHFFFWIILGISLPLAFLLGVINIPKYQAEPDDSGLSKFALVYEVSELSEFARYSIAKNKGSGKLYMELMVVKPLKAALPVVEVSDAKGGNTRILVKINSTGKYEFDIPEVFSNEKELNIVIKDQIKNRVVDKISLTGWE